MTKVKEYKITGEQLQRFTALMHFFEQNANEIAKLCDVEADDISYGFMLGLMHRNNRNYFIDMMDLEHEIKDQEIKY